MKWCSPVFNLLPVLNVYENIVYPIEIDGGKTDTRFVKEIIHTLGLEQKLKNMPNNLSGGQQQRLSLIHIWCELVSEQWTMARSGL